MGTRRIATAAVWVSALALAGLGCREESGSPTDPVPHAAEAGVVSPLATLSFRVLSAGYRHTCGVTTDNRAWCWGGGVTTPALVPGGLRFLEVSAGQGITCGVTTDHRAYCWEGDAPPVEVPGGRRFRQVTVGGGDRSGNYACGVTPADVAFCWGGNEFGRQGTSKGSSETPVAVAGGLRFRRVYAAFSHTCGVTTDDKAYCWGANVSTAQGFRNRSTPVAVPGGQRFRIVRPGSGVDVGITSVIIEDWLSCGVTRDDRAYCWGFGALGSNFDSSVLPVPVAGGHRFNFVHPGLFFACALNLSDQAFCWGINDRGQLGRPGIGSRTPVRVAGGLRFLNLTVGATGWHTCGVTRTNRAYCWGDNSLGQLGDGTTTDRASPVAVASPAT